MTELHHIYLTAHGTYTGAAWVGEFAQIGLRLAVKPANDMPARGSLFDPAGGHGDVAVDAGTQAGTNGTLQRTWKARLGPVADNVNADAGYQVDLAQDMYAFCSSLAAKTTVNFRWTHAKIAPIAADGAYAAPSAIYQFTSPVIGTVATTQPQLPPEVALAVSMRAPVIGRRGRGRVYVPGLTVAALETDGTVNGATNTALGGYLKTLILALEDVPGVDVQSPVVMVTSAGAALAVRPVEVRVGNHWDAQRRRQHQVAEAFGVYAI